MTHDTQMAWHLDIFQRNLRLFEVLNIALSLEESYFDQPERILRKRYTG